MRLHNAALIKANKFHILKIQNKEKTLKFDIS